MSIPKNILAFLLLILTSIHLYADDPHQLWLRKHSAKTVTVKANSKSVIINNAIEALKKGWQGENSAQIKLNIVKDKAIKDDKKEQ